LCQYASTVQQRRVPVEGERRGGEERDEGRER